MEKTKEQKQLENLTLLVATMMKNQFYGELLIKMNAGQIVVLKKTESIKVD
jgi:hypothetical protein